MKIAVLISGRGSNLQSLIDKVQSGYIPAEIAVVISNKKDAFGLERAKKAGIETVFVDSQNKGYEEEILRVLQKKEVDLVCLAGYMKIVGPLLVNAYRNRMINIHPALLPSFPGLHGQKQALDWGVKVAGATVHFVDEECDHGPIILQKAVPVLDDDTEESLSARILAEEHQLYPEAVKLFCEGRLSIESRKVKIRGN